MQHFHLLQSHKAVGETFRLTYSSLNYENNSTLGHVALSWFYFVEYHYILQISKTIDFVLQNTTSFPCIFFSVFVCFHHFSKASPHRSHSQLSCHLYFKVCGYSREGQVL